MSLSAHKVFFFSLMLIYFLINSFVGNMELHCPIESKDYQ